MKAFIFLVLIFLKFSSTEASPVKQGYDESLASKLVYFAAASFIGPNDANADNLTNQCFTKAFPAGTWSTSIRYNINCQTDYANDRCQGLITWNEQLKVIVFAFRGTVGLPQLIHEAADSLKDFQNFSVPNTNANLGYVNKYFYQSMTQVWNQIKGYITDQKFTGYQFYFTGHSLGGAIATLAALQTRSGNYTQNNNLQLYTFGEPRVGDYVLATNIQNYLQTKYRVVHYRDPVPHMPFCRDNGTVQCQKQSGSPYHHPQEIWYKNSNQKMDVGINDYVTCSPTDGEDGTCSDSISDVQFILDGIDTKGADFHNHYFNHRLDQWGPNGCSSSTIVQFSSFLVTLAILLKLIF